MESVADSGLGEVLFRWCTASCITEHGTCGLCFVNDSAGCNVMYQKPIELHARTSQMILEMHLALQSD